MAVPSNVSQLGHPVSLSLIVLGPPPAGCVSLYSPSDPDQMHVSHSERCCCNCYFAGGRLPSTEHRLNGARVGCPNRGRQMLAIDVSDSDLLLAMPHRHGGVAHMLVALEDAGLGETGMYRLTVKGSAEIAARILEGIGCTVSPSPYPPT